ncbi:PAS domain-containing protein [Bacillus sp. SD075]|uniref:PAS domain-containing sensor histidine kinase n=1 Tax=Bacillus sp. SD075 TaxID=2781732 RepID=UPI001A957200|nr:PAS domain-containing sensor histidine kinase [Bacillus sp. SD075]MBO0996611.1 PAS domain-containing protein [Bacillus sp. SD075]
MKVFQSKLMKRYVAIVLVVVLFVLASLYMIAVNVINGSVRSQMEYRDELIAKTLGNQIENVFENSVSDMRQISPIVTNFDNDAENAYRAEMETILSHDPQYLFIEVYKEDQLALRLPDVPFSYFVENASIIKRLSWSQTSYISNMIELPDGRKTIAIAYPSINEKGEFKGSVVAYLNLQVLSDHLQRFAIGKEGVNAMIDRNGTIIAHTDQSYIGKSIQKHEVGIHLQKEDFDIWNGEIFSKDMVIAYRPILLGDIGLIVGEPIKQALQPARLVKFLLFQGFSIVFIIAIGLAMFSASRVIRPVTTLIKHVQEYKEGKRNAFVKVKTNDEIEDLSIVLSEMATELREKERSMFYILESIPYCVITTDKDGRIMTFNKGAEDLMLYRREEVLNQLIFNLPIKHDIQEFVLLKTFNAGKSFEEVESYIIDKEKGFHDVRIYASLLKGEQDEYIGSILVIRDVSDVKKLEEYLKQSERLASLGELTAGIAHEIKNPLSIIQVAAETIRLQIESEFEENEVIDELTGDILTASDRMNKLLTDFLKLTKDDEYNKHVQTDLVVITNELLNLLRRKFNDANIMVTTEYKFSKAPVLGDRHKLTQLLLNVFLNSIQAIKDEGDIHISLNEKGAYWKLSISDTGEGIKEDKLNWVFNPFYSTKPEGTGLGLSIAHEIIVQHGGEIWAESLDSQGTTIHIEILKYEENQYEEHSVCG